ncbi:tetratricopeptide repeat protein [Pseudomonas sp. PDM16]|uniref:YfgM family protein n=1 Tax=Pseudomonas sp. PDM16 TaxID=2769292 RepID=UPI00178227F5|nr:tetratricopeptide repeat protein [Pseudomonas sp. PDM16]
MTEEEQIAQLKDWWQRNGKPLLTGGVLALAIVFGWQGWQRYQTNQAQSAGAIYQQMLEVTFTADGKPDIGKVTELAAKLKKEYGSTNYAQYASLFISKLAVDNGKLDDALAELKPLLDKPADETVGEIARQRTARVLAAQGKAEDGLKLLEGKVAKAWLASREELRGDLLVQLGRGDEAHAAYQKAKDSLAEEAAVGSLQMKLDDLAKGDA